jgi:Zn-dependent oligopeptidase
MTDTSANPLLTRSALPFGLPEFPAARFEHYEPAIRAVMARAKKMLQR